MEFKKELLRVGMVVKTRNDKNYVIAESHDGLFLMGQDIKIMLDRYDDDLFVGRADNAPDDEEHACDIMAIYDIPNHAIYLDRADLIESRELLCTRTHEVRVFNKFLYLAAIEALTPGSAARLDINRIQVINALHGTIVPFLVGKPFYSVSTDFDFQPKFVMVRAYTQLPSTFDLAALRALDKAMAEYINPNVLNGSEASAAVQRCNIFDTVAKNMTATEAANAAFKREAMAIIGTRRKEP